MSESVSAFSCELFLQVGGAAEGVHRMAGHRKGMRGQHGLIAATRLTSAAPATYLPVCQQGMREESSSAVPAAPPKHPCAPDALHRPQQHDADRVVHNALAEDEAEQHGAAVLVQHLRR